MLIKYGVKNIRKLRSYLERYSANHIREKCLGYAAMVWHPHHDDLNPLRHRHLTGDFRFGLSDTRRVVESRLHYEHSELTHLGGGWRLMVEATRPLLSSLNTASTCLIVVPEGNASTLISV